MASDDVLWKQVEDLKARTTEKSSEPSAATDGNKNLKSIPRKTAKKVRNPLPAKKLNRSASRPTGRPANSQSSQLANSQQLGGRVVARPVSFYIPVSVDEKIDDALDYLEKRHGVKVDRSALVSAILGEPALWESPSLKQLAEKAVSQLTNRLASRLVSRSGE